MQKVPAGKVKIFDIENRRGYACICFNSLTEGKTPLEAYDRMIKAQKRKGRELAQIEADLIKKLVINV
jgi:hypothetical protein